MDIVCGEYFMCDVGEKELKMSGSGQWGGDDVKRGGGSSMEICEQT